MYTRVVHRPRELRPRHSVENQWDLLGAVDPRFAGGPDPDADRVEMPIDPAARDSVLRRLREAGVAERDPVVVLHVSAGNPFRRWPESSFAALTSGLVTGGDRRWVVLTSGPSDHEAVAHILADARVRARAPGRRILDGEGLSLAELRALMDRAALFVGGDSGPLHIAGTSNVPVVGLYGPTLKERSAPWRPRALPTVSLDAGALPCRPCDQRVCAPGDFRCLTRITAEDVLAAAERLLADGAPEH
jgi:ADP-heptose:LPS heptosyltransferase